jgi:hypothetical protein
MFLILLALAVPLQAQTVGATDYRVEVFISATNTTATRTVPVSAVTCNLVPTTANLTPPVNPTAIEIEDDINSTPIAPKACRVPVGDFFRTLPPAVGYVAHMVAINNSVTPPDISPRSAVPSDPFTVAAVRPPLAAPKIRGVRP